MYLCILFDNNIHIVKCILVSNKNAQYDSQMVLFSCVNNILDCGPKPNDKYPGEQAYCVGGPCPKGMKECSKSWYTENCKSETEEPKARCCFPKPEGDEKGSGSCHRCQTLKDRKKFCKKQKN